MTTQTLQIKGESKVITGHVLDVAKAPLDRALRRYDPLLYTKWNPNKNRGLGVWELRRRPEFKSVRESRYLDSPKGRVLIPGDIMEFDDFTISIPKYHETNFENHVKDFQYLSYEIVTWLSGHDLWQYGYKGKNTTTEAEYREAKWLEKIDEDAHTERNYMIKQHRSEFRDYAEYINDGGNPARLVDFWGK